MCDQQLDIVRASDAFERICRCVSANSRHDPLQQHASTESHPNSTAQSSFESSQIGSFNKWQFLKLEKIDRTTKKWETSLSLFWVPSASRVFHFVALSMIHTITSVDPRVNCICWVCWSGWSRGMDWTDRMHAINWTNNPLWTNDPLWNNNPLWTINPWCWSTR